MCRDSTEKKKAAALNLYKMVCPELCFTYIVISLYEPYLSFSSVFVSNKTLSAAGEHH